MGGKSWEVPSQELWVFGGLFDNLEENLPYLHMQIVKNLTPFSGNKHFLQL